METRTDLDLTSLWRVVLADIELSVSKANFTIWFKNTSLLQREGEMIVVGAPNIFTREWLENKYYEIILEALQRVDRTIQKVRYEITTRSPIPSHATHGATVLVTKRAVDAAAPPFSLVGPTATADAPPSASRFDAESNLNRHYTFEAFVVGTNNELAYAAAQAVARRPGAAYNPLFIYGGVGLGKTHLLQAIGNALVAQGRIHVRYAPLERFMHELIAAIQMKATHSFKERYRSVDVLIVDDIQSIVGKEKTQEEFFHTFNELHGAGKQIIISSDRPPKAIPTLQERLQSRFEGGMIADIQPPDLETRIAILKAKCALRSVPVAEDVLAYIATQAPSNIRELEGMLNRVLANCELEGSTATLLNTKEVLATILAKPRRRIVHTERIIDAVSQHYHLSPKDLMGNSRRKEIVRPRQIAMYLLRNENGFSFPTIGHTFGGRDHTTAMHACAKIVDFLETDEELRQDLTLIRQKLYIAVEV